MSQDVRTYAIKLEHKSRRYYLWIYDSISYKYISSTFIFNINTQPFVVLLFIKWEIYFSLIQTVFMLHVPDFWIKLTYLAERLKSSFRKFYGRYGDLIEQYEVSLSRMLNDILILDQQWLPNLSDFPPISWHWYRAWPSPIMSGFHGAFATDMACQQGTLTLPDTWFRPPLWVCLCSNCWDQIPRTCHVFTRLFTSNVPCYFLDFVIKIKIKHCLFWIWITLHGNLNIWYYIYCSTESVNSRCRMHI